MIISTCASAELSPTPRAVGSPVLAAQLLTQTRGEHPALARVGARDQLLAATWLAGHRSPATRAAYAKETPAPPRPAPDLGFPVSAPS